MEDAETVEGANAEDDLTERARRHALRVLARSGDALEQVAAWTNADGRTRRRRNTQFASDYLTLSSQRGDEIRAPESWAKQERECATHRRRGR